MLEVRRLLEERAALELQVKTAELCRLEKEAERQSVLERETREDARRQILARDPNSWLGLADAEIFSWREQRIRALAHRVSVEVADLLQWRTTRRMERLQAEFLLGEWERAQEQEESRREQQHLDDWFQNRPSSASRRMG